MQIICRLEATQAIATLEDLLERYQDPSPLMQAWAEIVKQGLDKWFTQERSPGGQPWAALAPVTVAARIKRGYTPIRILQASGKGRSNIDVQTDRKQVRVYFGGNNTSYMKYHLTGTKRMPARPFLPADKDLKSGDLGKELIQSALDYFAVQPSTTGGGIVGAFL